MLNVGKKLFFKKDSKFSPQFSTIYKSFALIRAMILTLNENSAGVGPRM
jgi:hypothetical protein